MENANLSLFNNNFLSRPKNNTIMPHASLNTTKDLFRLTGQGSQNDISQYIDILYNDEANNENLFDANNTTTTIKSKTIHSKDFWI